jgi:hypothetical protein
MGVGLSAGSGDVSTPEKQVNVAPSQWIKDLANTEQP